VTAGRVHTISFRNPTPGVYHLTVTAYDHANNHGKVLAIIGVRVK